MVVEGVGSVASALVSTGSTASTGAFFRGIADKAVVIILGLEVVREKGVVIILKSLCRLVRFHTHCYHTRVLNPKQLYFGTPNIN